jgi:hypothetical protein
VLCLQHQGMQGLTPVVNVAEQHIHQAQSHAGGVQRVFASWAACGSPCSHQVLAGSTQAVVQLGQKSDRVALQERLNLWQPCGLSVCCSSGHYAATWPLSRS